jgi:hypothetical protein
MHLLVNAVFTSKSLAAGRAPETPFSNLHTGDMSL